MGFLLLGRSLFLFSWGDKLDLVYMVWGGGIIGTDYTDYTDFCFGIKFIL